VTSFINIRYGNFAIEIIPQGTAMCYSFAVEKMTVQMPFSLRSVQYFRRPATHDWCKKFAHGRESAVDEE